MDNFFLDFLPQPLDRDPPEGKARWTLRVTASDGQLEATTGVQINLKDVNDNAPKFPKELVRAAVPENAPAGNCLQGNIQLFEPLTLFSLNFL